MKEALGSHWGSFRVALRWLWGRNRLAINTLCGGFDVALRWLELTFRGFSFQHFSFCQSVAFCGIDGMRDFHAFAACSLGSNSNVQSPKSER
jgi:hypothetical protein